MKASQIGVKGLNLIKKYEGLKLKPYLCAAGLPTIGFGATYYPNGTKVKLTDKAISEFEASTMLGEMLKHYEKSVDSFTRDDITQNQFDALVCFSYNVGLGALGKSTLLKKININPNSEEIEAEFMKWSFAKHIQLEGLRLRRKAESELYEKVN